MSTITRMVEDEAAKAEAEEPDGEEEAADEPDPADGEGNDGDGEGEPEASAAALPSFDPAKLESEQRRHEKALRGVFGDDWPGMVVCMECGSLGFVPANLEPTPDVVPDPDLVVCDACNGYGQRLTPSREPTYATSPCTKCVGKGYRGRAEVEAEQRANDYASYAPPPAPPAPTGGMPAPGQPVWNQTEQRWETYSPAAGY